MMRVLVISRECWRSDSNEGSTLTSLFAGQPLELANVYCKPGVPDNGLCTQYFQLTDRMALDKLLHGKPMGRAFAGTQDETAALPEAEDKPFYDFFRLNNLEAFYFARELLWKLSGVQSEALRAFVQAFRPDVIFAPMSYSPYVLAIQRFVIRVAKRPAATYLYDDIYSLRQFRFSPFYWINRMNLRSAVRRTAKHMSIAYTMTQEQADEYRGYLPLDLRVLRKPAQTLAAMPHARYGMPLRFLYAGGVYLGRDKTLMRVAEALRTKFHGQARLDIYTNSPLRQDAAAVLNDGVCTFTHPAVPSRELPELYARADVALHVESFRKRFAQMVRLSFSAKIADCLGSGCAVLAICPESNAGYRYLVHEDAAICIDDPRRIGDAIARLAEQPALIEEYAGKALACARRNHDKATIQAELLRELTELAAAPSHVTADEQR